VKRLHFKTWIISLLCLSVLPQLPAQQTSPATKTLHSVWKIQGAHNSVYLMGSIHTLKQENYPLAAPFETAFNDSQIAVFETDIDKMEATDVQFKLLSKAQLPAGQSLQQVLSKDTYTQFLQRAQKAGLPELLFSRLQPAMAAVMLETLELQKLGVDPEYGLDKHFFALAQKTQKQIVPLETLDFQMDLLTTFSKEEGELFVKATLKDLDKTTDEFGEIVKAWQTGDANALEKLLNEAMQEAPAIFKRLLLDRNARWIPKLEELSRGQKNAVVIVGAAHLVGKDGLVESLRQKGLKVTQL
jgi:uncharacterized protein YbaP (TraB family)